MTASEVAALREEVARLKAREVEAQEAGGWANWRHADAAMENVRLRAQVATADQCNDVLKEEIRTLRAQIAALRARIPPGDQ